MTTEEAINTASDSVPSEPVPKLGGDGPGATLSSSSFPDLSQLLADAKKEV